jgi:hypothetical protein
VPPLRNDDVTIILSTPKKIIFEGRLSRHTLIKAPQQLSLAGAWFTHASLLSLSLFTLILEFITSQLNLDFESTQHPNSFLSI